MSWFVPSNLPIVAGMLWCKPTNFNVLGMQAINQTYNACWNYSNRNATSSFSTQDLLQSYGIALGVSVGIALLGNQVAKKFVVTSGSIAKKRFVNGALAVSAMWLAGFWNLYFIRQNEIKKGITIKH